MHTKSRTRPLTCRPMIAAAFCRPEAPISVPSTVTSSQTLKTTQTHDRERENIVHPDPPPQQVVHETGASNEPRHAMGDPRNPAGPRPAPRLPTTTSRPRRGSIRRRSGREGGHRHLIRHAPRDHGSATSLRGLFFHGEHRTFRAPRRRSKMTVSVATSGPSRPSFARDLPREGLRGPTESQLRRPQWRRARDRARSTRRAGPHGPRIGFLA